MESQYDKTAFKILTERDIGSPGLRAQGPLIPVDLRGLFPPLPAPTASRPVPSRPIRVTYLDSEGIGHTVASRYHRQTRGRHRTGETWVTGELGSFLAGATPGDMLFISSKEGDFTQYRFDLFKQGTPEFRAVMCQLTPGLQGRWGVLVVPSDTVILPHPEQIRKEKASVIAQTEAPFRLEDPHIRRRESSEKRFVRDRAFHEIVVEQYQYRCAVCQSRLTTPNGLAFEVEAAHIRPRSQRGPDDVRNGLGLCRTHHWALDSGVISIHVERRTVLVAIYPQARRDEQEIKALGMLADQPVLCPVDASCIPAAEALEWHNRKVFLG